MSALARVLSSAVRTDLLADSLGAYSQAERAQIVAAYPRGLAAARPRQVNEREEAMKLKQVPLGRSEAAREE
jgi:DNA invertase Pin-like site-specific DNA recombinase